jgi:hypothetical protein
LLAAFAYPGRRSLTDDLVDLLIETIRHIGARAERKVERERLNDLKRVSGKQNLFLELADAGARDQQQHKLADAHRCFGCLLESARHQGGAKKAEMET